MFKSIFSKIKELKVEVNFTKTGLSLAYRWKKSNELLTFPLQTDVRKLINNWAPEKAMSLYSLETMLLEFNELKLENTEQMRKQLGFDSKMLDAPLIEFKDNRLEISYLAIYSIINIASDELSVNKSDLSKLGVPDYDYIQINIKQKNIVQNSNLSIQSVFKDASGAIIEIERLTGHIAHSRNENDYFLSPLQANLVCSLLKHKDVINEDAYKLNEYNRICELSKITRLARRAQAKLCSLLESEEYIVLEDLDYTVGRDVHGEVLLNPVMPIEYSEFDNNLHKGFLELADSNLTGKQFKLEKKDNSVARVVFAEAAEKKYKLITDLKSQGQGKLEEVLSLPESFLTTKPRQPGSTYYSDRVSGFVFGSVKYVDPDQKSNIDWGLGFEGESVFFMSTSGSPISIEHELKLDLYKEVNEALIESKLTEGETSKHVDGLRVESLDDSISYDTAEVFLKGVENSFVFDLPEERFEEAAKLISEAEAQSSVMVNWPTIEGDTEEIQELPLASLKKSVKRAAPSVEKVGMAVPSTSENINSGIIPSMVWDWDDHAKLSEVNEIPNFKDEINLHAHQCVGFNWLRWVEANGPHAVDINSKGCLIADDMGVGKTIQVLALIATHINSLVDNQESILIVAPVSLLDTSWCNDGFKKFFKEESISIGYVNNSKASVMKFSDCPIKVPKKLLNQELKRVQDELDIGKEFTECEIDSELINKFNEINNWCKGKIILISYESLVSHSTYLATVDFKLVVLDEAQKIKNAGTLRSEAAKALKSEMCITMTGTPIENSIVDLWNIIDFSVPGYLGTRPDFKKNFKEKIKSAPEQGPEREAVKKELEESLHPIWLRRTKKDVITDDNQLPEAIHYDSDENNNYINKHAVEMSDEQYKLYSNAVAYFNNAGRGGKLPALQRMLQLCSAPWLRDKVEQPWKNHKNLFQLCPKLKCLMDILDSVRQSSESEGQKVLLFCNLLDLQKSLSGFIQSWHLDVANKEINVSTYNGTLSQKERKRRIDEFKNKPGFQVLIISPKSGGVGLNLQEANHVIHYTREWNPAIEKQATDRAYRFGQDKTVHVYYPTTSLAGKDMISAEENLAKLLNNKREVVDDFTITTESSLIKSQDFTEVCMVNGIDAVINMDNINDLCPIDFEIFISLLLNKNGYTSEWIGAPGDGGADVIARKDGINYLIQCKHTKQSKPLNSKAIDNVRAAKSKYEKERKQTYKLVAITNYLFGDAAKARSVNGDFVDLWDNSMIQKLLGNVIINQSEINIIRNGDLYKAVG